MTFDISSADQPARIVEPPQERVIDVRGLSFSPTRGFSLSDSTALDYFVTAVAQ